MTQRACLRLCRGCVLYPSQTPAGSTAVGCMLYLCQVLTEA